MFSFVVIKKRCRLATFFLCKIRSVEGGGAAKHKRRIMYIMYSLRCKRIHNMSEFML